jgi:UDP-2,3-diacylglucosamine pyrophosphatase LpxH
VTRTLVISDLHIGSRRRPCVLSRQAALDALLGALDGCDRLVLLGDTVEMTEIANTQDALVAAAPILRAIGRRLGTAREVLVVPGNHDRGLIRAWLQAHARELTAETAVPADATPALAFTTECLAPARVSVRYPGVWLGSSIWATHGHYLDRHLFPIGAYGIARSWRSQRGGTARTAFDYEQALRPGRRAPAMWQPRWLAGLIEGFSELARASTMPGRGRRTARRDRWLPRLAHGLLHPRLAPLTSTLLGGQMRRFSIPALVTVAEHLGIEAQWVLFGHVHRLGPLPGDDPRRWSGPDGRPRLANAGSWIYEPLLVHHARPPHPYWPGGAILLENGSEPRAIGLLDGLTARELS